MLAHQLKEYACKIERELGGEFADINHYIYEHPELGLEEYESSKYLVEYLRSKGFSVEYPYCSFDTAFCARFGSKGPSIAFLAEYDALPGYGPDLVNGHACGHNFIASTCVGAAVVLSRMAEELNIRISVVGCPAEETYCTKVAMVREGAFADTDVALQAHISDLTTVCSVGLAMTSLKIDFEGKASHAAAAPWDGVNALDAVQLFYAGINALRQHVKPDVRIHGVVTSGGQAANIVPDKAGCLFYVRSSSREYLDTVLPKVENIAKGAALMTGAKLTITYPELPLDNLVRIPALQALTAENLSACGVVPTGTPEHAQEIAGSTDVGNVSHACPTMYMECSLADGTPVMVHEESALSLVDCPAAIDTMHRVINAMAGIAIDIATDAKLLETIKSEFDSSEK